MKGFVVFCLFFLSFRKEKNGLVLSITILRLNAKITEIEGRIPSITTLATNSTLTAVENKIPNASNLVTKTNYNAKISEIENKVNDHNHGKYITIPDFNRLTTENFSRDKILKV